MHETMSGGRTTCRSRQDEDGTPADVSRRSFLTQGAAAGVGVAVLTGGGTREASAQPTRWDYSADVVVIGAGVAGLPAAIAARDHGASVIVVEENFDIGGRGMLSGGRVQLGGGHALQQKFGIKDSPDQVFADWVRHDHGDSRYNDRDLVRAFADDNVATFQFLIENGVEFIEKPIKTPDASTVDRIFVTKEWHIPSEVIAPRRNRNGSGLVRRLAESARKKGAQILLKHEMTSIVRETGNGRRVLGIIAQGTAAIRQHRGQEGRRHRDRRAHRQRQLPPHVRSAADRGVPAGLRCPIAPGRRRRARRDGYRRFALGDRQPDQRGRRRHHQDAAHRLPLGLLLRWSTRPTAPCFAAARRPGLR